MSNTSHSHTQNYTEMNSDCVIDWRGGCMSVNFLYSEHISLNISAIILRYSVNVKWILYYSVNVRMNTAAGCIA